MPAPAAPLRLVLDQIADKWSILVLGALCPGPLRFNALRRQLGTVTHKALTQTLRRLERNGILTRTVAPGPPVAVTYALTPLGHSLKKPFAALHQWTLEHERAILSAQKQFDARARPTA